MEVCMEKIISTIEIPAVIKVNCGQYDKENDRTSIEIKAPGLHIIFDLPGKHESRFAQKRISEGVDRLNKRGLLPIANNRLWLVMQQLP